MTKKEALNKVRQMSLPKEMMDILEALIPELHESEDERIRKALIDALKVSETIGELKFRLPYPTREECIAYLEKQQERNPINHNLTTWHRDVVYCAMCDENLDEGLRCNLEVVYKTIKELVDRTPVVEEQKPAEWSEEDEKMLRIIRLALTKHPITDKQEKDAFDWLNSLRPQPRAKTNDYITPHKKFFQWIYNRLIDVHNENPNVDYMRSFKERIDNLQFDEPHWKPSEEQMDALRASNSYWKGTTNEVPRTDLLESLYNDLEKLIAKR